MLKCEINKNIVTQQVEIYLIDRDYYFTYENGVTVSHNRDPFTADGTLPYLVIPYDVWEPLKEAFKQELNVEKIEGSASHIKDLRWVLDHFMSKDKK